MKTVKNPFVVFILFIVFFPSISLLAKTPSPFFNIRKNLPVFTSAQIDKSTKAMLDYLKFYQLPNHVKHHMGVVKVGDEEIVTQVFYPKENTGFKTPKGTVLFLHGYYDHVGIIRHGIRALVDEGYVVLAYDQVGHGLSSGARASIDGFDEYQVILDYMVKTHLRTLPAPYHLVTHSTGGAVGLHYLLRQEALPKQKIEQGTPVFKQAVFLAPLVRSAHWKLSVFANKIAPPFVKSVKRKFRRNSSDQSFLKFLSKEDPLQYKRLPLAWVTALQQWNKKIEGMSPSKQIVCIIQGNKDSTVDWRYNMKLIKRKFPQVKIHQVNGAGHQLMNESEKIRKGVLEKLLKALSPPGV